MGPTPRSDAPPGEDLRSRRATVRRHPERARYDRETVWRILDGGLVCHLGIAVDGRPLVLPMAYGRSGDRLYLHGARAAGVLRGLAAGMQGCVTVTHLDGVVFARSAFHHSFNYRSVALFGTAAEVTDRREKLDALRAIVEQVAPGRWDESRQPSEKELAATRVLRFPIAEASAKVRSGPPVEDAADLEPGTWGGVVPLRLAPGKPEPDAHVEPRATPPRSVLEWGRLEEED